MPETGYLKNVLSLPVITNMRPAPPTVTPFDAASTVLDLMTKQNVGSVLVVENNHPLGIVTEKDILQRVLNKGKNLELTLVKDIMSKPLVTIEAERTIADALETLQKHNIRRLVITHEGTLVGLTTTRRLLEITQGYMMKDRGLLETDYDKGRRIRIAYVSTYPPRECGIATYTKHLVDATSAFCTDVVSSPLVVAINDRGGHYDYEVRVQSQIEDNNVRSYEKVAEYLNDSDIHVVNLQHEYGIFGGEWGEYVIELVQRIEKPIVTTLHTVLEEPVLKAKTILDNVLEHSDFVTVMARVGIGILEQQYGSYADKIRYIPHGCPNVPQLETAMTKQRLGLGDHLVLSTFGLLSRGKGIEYVVEALPQIKMEHPDILYLIIGETHPEVRKHEGENYRQSLLNLVESLGLQENVGFVNRFLTENELINYLQATDVYVVPYPNREQISSGTLAYALSTGKAIVTTPFLHAQEVISHGAALGCDFKNPQSIAESVNMLLKDNQIRQRLSRAAYDYSRAMIWPNVAMSYVNLFYRALGL
ncbi:MAG TPA: CBS domain-containing protein [Candidatus Dormibacteraeota bacterium]|nr:CBS domain-containing protein [Candidatus Dormibacteraeota bacterium]